MGNEAENKEKQHQVENRGKTLGLSGEDHAPAELSTQHATNDQRPSEQLSRRKHQPVTDAQLLRTNLGHVNVV